MFLFLPIVLLGGILIYIYSNYRHLLWLKPIELKPLQPRTTVTSGFRSACVKCGSENTFLIDNQCNGGCNLWEKVSRQERIKEITRGQESLSSSRTPNSLVINVYDSVSEININKRK